MRFEYELQPTARGVAGSLQSMNCGWFDALKPWLTPHLHNPSQAMIAVLTDGGFQRRRASCATGAPSIQGIPKLVATLGPSRRFGVL
jgi:hypothetical protein